MAEFNQLTSQCDEVLMLIFYSLDGQSILRLAQTCTKFHRICTYDQALWSRMCLLDFTIGLLSPHPFTCFRHLYKCIHQSREILKFHLSDAYQNNSNNRYGVFPSWLWTWVVFNTNPPLLPDWIRNYDERFLRYKLGEIALGKTLRVWCLKSSDLPRHIVTRVEYGTSYYRWRDIQVAAMRVHGGPKGFEKFMLKRCWRARGYVERAFERIQNGTFLLPNRNKRGENSAQFGEGSHSTQIFASIAQVSGQASRQAPNGYGQVAYATRQAVHGSGQIAHGSGQISHAPGQIAHVFGAMNGSRQIAHGSGQIAHGSGQIAHAPGQIAPVFGAMNGLRQIAHGSDQVAHGSGQFAHASGQLMHGSRQVAHGLGLVVHAPGHVAHAFRPVAHGSGQISHGLAELAHNSGHAAHDPRQAEHESPEDAAHEVGESSRQSAQYVFSSSSESSMEID